MRLVLVRGLISIVLLPFVHGAKITDFGAVGDGRADDTAAIQRAVRENTDGILEFPRGEYRLTAPILIHPEIADRISLQGNGVGCVIMSAAGPAFRFVGTHRKEAKPNYFADDFLARERMPHVGGLEIVGDHPEAVGIEFSFVMQPTVRGVLIERVRHGIHFTALGERRPVTSNRNVLVANSHIRSCFETGILFDAIDIHQLNITGSHISLCRRGGIRLNGATVRNLQIVGNDIEYNYDAEATESADIWIDISQRGSVREGAIVGNTIQSVRTLGGANIRFRGKAGTPDKTGLWTITGNHISAQDANIHLQGSRGVSIFGNSFNRGGRQTILIEDCRNIVVGANTLDDNPDYPAEGRPWENGIVIRSSAAVLVSGVQSAGSLQGSPQSGGAIEVRKSREVSIHGCQILDPMYRGIFVDESTNVLISENLIASRRYAATFIASLEVVASPEGVLVADNSLASGRRGPVIGGPGRDSIDSTRESDMRQSGQPTNEQR